MQKILPVFFGGKFKTYRNVSNLTIRAHIKMLFNSSELENNAKDLGKKRGLF
jgi:hypothetical protein